MRALRLARLNCVLETADALAGYGIPFEALRWRGGFRNWLAGEPDGLIPVDEHLYILEAAAAAAGSASFGLEVGRRSRLDNQGAFGRRVMQSATLWHALTSFCRLMPWQASSDGGALAWTPEAWPASTPAAATPTCSCCSRH